MFSGIKRGKKSQKNRSSSVAGSTNATIAQPASEQQKQQQQQRGTDISRPGKDTNSSIADQLRQSLAAGVAPAVAPSEANPKPLTPGDGSDPIYVDVEHQIKNESEMTVNELLAHERSNRTSLSEQEARNVLRDSKKRKASTDSDQEEERQLRVTAKDNRQHAATSRAVAQYDRQEKITAACWWWIESIRFERFRLLALGKFTSFVLPKDRLVPDHYYLVPVQHAPSLTTCDENAWVEIRQFQASLQQMASRSGKEVIFFETVTPSKSFWQTRIECVFVPQKNDAKLFFRNALTEVAEEWGTHQKILKTGREKPLTSTIPHGFSYFYVEYADGSGNVQMIETTSFQKNFGIDTIAGMMRMDPLRFRSRRIDDEKWKTVDWTRLVDST